MRFCVPVSAICILTSPAANAQWSAPVTLAESISPYDPGPELVPVRGDTAWVFWIHEDAPPEDRLAARFFTAETWRGRELLAVGSEGLYWPAGIADDSGRLLVAFYEIEGHFPHSSVTRQCIPRRGATERTAFHSTAAGSGARRLTPQPPPPRA